MITVTIIPKDPMRPIFSVRYAQQPFECVMDHIVLNVLGETETLDNGLEWAPIGNRFESANYTYQVEGC